MNLCLASFASVCLGYGLAYREILAVILGSNRLGLPLFHGGDLLLGRTQCPLQSVSGAFLCV